MRRNGRLLLSATRADSVNLSLRSALELDDQLRRSYIKQDLFVGWDVMSGDRQRELNHRLIERVNRDRDCAVDGLRHRIDLESLQAEFGTRFSLIYVDTPPEVRFGRLRDRYSTYEEFLLADSHPVEGNVDSLKSLASVVFPDPLPPSRLAVELKAFVGRFRLDLSDNRTQAVL